MANEIILVGDVHANELKILNWQLKCNHYKDYLQIKFLDYLDTFTPMKDVDIKKVREATDKLAKLMIELEVYFDTRTHR